MCPGKAIFQLSLSRGQGTRREGEKGEEMRGGGVGGRGRVKWREGGGGAGKDTKAERIMEERRH